MTRRLARPKECPGCNQPIILYSGITLCAECRRLIALGKQIESIAQDNDLVELTIGDGFVHAQDVRDHKEWDPNTKLEFGSRLGSSREIVRLLATLLSQRLVGGSSSFWSGKDPAGEIRSVDRQKVAATHQTCNYNALVKRSSVELVRDLLMNIYILLNEQYRFGYERGHSLLSGLASGRLNINDYNDDVARNIPR